MKRLNFSLLIIALFSLICLSCSKPLEGDLILSNVNIIDVISGDIQQEMDVSIKGDSIFRIIRHKAKTQYDANQVIDATDNYLIPGLWDMHTHTWWAYNEFSPLLLAYGITGVREMFGGDLASINKIKEDLANGNKVGPMIISSGPIVDGDPPTWGGSDVARTPEEGRKIVRDQKAAGADFVKVYFSLENDVYLAMADEAQKQSIPIGGHIPSKVSLEEALEAQHWGIEHGWGILDNCADHTALSEMDSLQTTRYNLQYAYDRMEKVMQTFDDAKIDETLNLLTEKNVWICPTFVAHLGAIRELDINYPMDDHVYYMPEFVYAGWGIEKDSVLSDESARRIAIDSAFLNRFLSMTRSLANKNIRLLAGTDYPVPYTYPGISLHEELQVFVEKAGLTPLQALQSATWNPAIFMGKEAEMGSIETGKTASLVLLDKNPLEDINNTRSINAVIVAGNYLEGHVLRNEIDAIAAKNKLPKIWERLYTAIEDTNIDQAITLYHNLKQEQPDAYNFDEEQLNTLGYELLEAGKTEKAIKILRLNIKTYPDYANGYDSLGDAYMEAGMKQEAIAAWEKAVAKGSLATQSKLDVLKE